MLTQSNYVSECFEGLALAEKTFDGVSFDNCHFIDCDFSNSRFNGCTLSDCHFLHCNLNLVHLGYSRFHDVTFDNSKLMGLDWTKVNWPNFQFFSPIKFNQCLLSESTFYGLNLKELTLTACKAHNTDFQNGDFSHSDFGHTDFTGSIFHNTNIAGVNFCDAVAYDIDIRNNTIKGAKFTRIEALSLLEGLEIELLD